MQGEDLSLVINEAVSSCRNYMYLEVILTLDKQMNEK